MRKSCSRRSSARLEQTEVVECSKIKLSFPLYIFIFIYISCCIAEDLGSTS